MVAKLRQVVRAYKVEASGASFRVAEEFAFLFSTKDRQFRPCHMTVGPDGAVYVVDRREEGKGRILRVSWGGTKDREAIDLRATRIEDVMTRTPKSIGSDALAVEAAQMMEAHKINALLVLDDGQRVVGALNIHDLLRARVV